eukprot:2675564-Prymnesium_polylepis.2
MASVLRRCGAARHTRAGARRRRQPGLISRKPGPRCDGRRTAWRLMPRACSVGIVDRDSHFVGGVLAVFNCRRVHHCLEARAIQYKLLEVGCPGEEDVVTDHNAAVTQHVQRQRKLEVRLVQCLDMV